MDSLSLNAYADVAVARVADDRQGSLHVSPPLVDWLARTALALFVALNERLTW